MMLNGIQSWLLIVALVVFPIYGIWGYTRKGD